MKEHVALIIEKQGKILLQLRDDKESIPFPNRWSTFGGAIEEGESPEEALRREIREELGYGVNGVSKVGKYDAVHVYRIVDDDFDLDDYEVMEGQKGQFFTPHEIEELDFAFRIGEYVEDYCRRFLS